MVQALAYAGSTKETTAMRVSIVDRTTPSREFWHTALSATVLKSASCNTIPKILTYFANALLALLEN